MSGNDEIIKVSINAPSLDNSDQGSMELAINDGFQYVKIGDEDRNAQLPLYKKFLSSGEVNKMVDLNGLSRTNFISGKVADRNESIDIGGDYSRGNTSMVLAKNFKVGRLTGLRFRLFEIDEITVGNRPNNGVNFDHHLITNYSSVAPKVAIYTPVFKDDGSLHVDNFICTAYANFVGIDTDGSGLYTVQSIGGDNFIEIPGKWLTTNNCTLAFSFLSSTGATVETNVVPKSNSNFRGNNRAIVGLRGLPRSSNDNMSYICYPTDSNNFNTNGARNSGENRILDFDYIIDVDLVEEFIGSNAGNHHLNISDVKALNSMKYNAPSINITNYNRKNTAAKKVFISHSSLTRNNIFSITGEKISSIQIPFTSTTDGNDYENGSTMKNGDFDGGGSLWHTNRVVWIWQGEGTPDDLIADDDDTNILNGWIKSNEIIVFSYFETPNIYNITFGSDGIEYKGKGLWISAHRPSEDRQGNNTLAVHYYENDSGKYSYNSLDKIYSTHTTAGFNATANIKVNFTYNLRSDWFDYIEASINELRSLINGN